MEPRNRKLGKLLKRVTWRCKQMKFRHGGRVKVSVTGRPKNGRKRSGWSKEDFKLREIVKIEKLKKKNDVRTSRPNYISSKVVHEQGNKRTGKNNHLSSKTRKIKPWNIETGRQTKSGPRNGSRRPTKRLRAGSFTDLHRNLYFCFLPPRPSYCSSSSDSPSNNAGRKLFSSLASFSRCCPQP